MSYLLLTFAVMKVHQIEMMSRRISRKDSENATVKNNRFIFVHICK